MFDINVLIIILEYKKKCILPGSNPSIFGDDLVGFVYLIPIAQHGIVSPRPNLSWGIDWHDLSCKIDDFCLLKLTELVNKLNNLVILLIYFDVIRWLTNCGAPNFQAIRRLCLERYWATFSHAIHALIKKNV